jgi:ribosomal protein S9
MAETKIPNISARDGARPPSRASGSRPAPAKSPSTDASLKIISRWKRSASTATQPLTVTGTAEKFDVRINVTGGGPTARPARCGTASPARLLQFDATLRGALKAEGLLTRDSRMKERKKYGQPGARKRFQFSKR